jgi:hypothetical protein
MLLVPADSMVPNMGIYEWYRNGHMKADDMDANVALYLLTYSPHPRVSRIVVYVTRGSSIFPTRVSNAPAQVMTVRCMRSEQKRLEKMQILSGFCGVASGGAGGRSIRMILINIGRGRRSWQREHANAQDVTNRREMCGRFSNLDTQFVGLSSMRGVT